jgi:hypothetical protein
MAPLTPPQALLSTSRFRPLLLSRATNSTVYYDFVARGPGLRLGSTISIAVTLVVLLFIVTAALTYVILVANMVF